MESATTTVTIDPPTMLSSRASRRSMDVSSSSANPQAQQRHGSHPAPANDDPPTESKPFKPTRRFWLVMLSISAMSLCGSVEGTIVVNALPTIAAALSDTSTGGNLFLWVPNAFFLASIAVLPLWAQLSDIFGRRRTLLTAGALFVLGGALCGASTSMAMLIAARTVQGLGSGGVDTLCETVILDLVPLRDRAKYLAYVSLGTTLGYIGGPFLGGLIVVKLGWRWVFYLNALLGGAALVMFFFFLRVRYRRGETLWARLQRIDVGGHAIFVGAVVAVLLALTWAGPVAPWDSARVLVPLAVGLVGLFAFLAFEWAAPTRLGPREPSFPRAIVANRTSAAALAMTLVNSITMYGTFYFLPVFFQGVQAKSPLGSGVALAPVAAMVVPCAVVAGVVLSKVGKYRPVHAVGWAAMLVALGLFSTLDRHSRPAAWACFEVLAAAGLGALTISLLPALQAPLPERHAAASAGMYSFARGFGAIWGVTIPAAVFSNVVKRQASTASGRSAFAATDPDLAARLADGQAYQLATKAFLDSLPHGALRGQVIAVFEHAIHVVFYTLVGFAGLGLLLVLLEKEVPMRTENKTEFGLDEGGGAGKDGGDDDHGRVVGEGELGRDTGHVAAATAGGGGANSGSGRAGDVIYLEEVN